MLLIKRFDRTAGGGRKHHISAATLLQAGPGENITYLDLLSAMHGACDDFATDAQQLWRRLVFYLLVTHVDEGLHKVGFLYVGIGGRGATIYHYDLATRFSGTPNLSGSISALGQW